MNEESFADLRREVRFGAVEATPSVAIKTQGNDLAKRL